MGVLADLYVSRNDAEAISYDSEPSNFADREQFTSFTELELSTLWSLMRAVEWDVSMLKEFSEVFQESNGERAIFRLLNTMTEGLSRLTVEQVSNLATSWAATEELACAPDDVKRIILGLMRLAGRASATGRSVYFGTASDGKSCRVPSMSVNALLTTYDEFGRKIWRLRRQSPFPNIGNSWIGHCISLKCASMFAQNVRNMSVCSAIRQECFRID